MANATCLNTDKMKISLITVCYNAEMTMEKTILSVLNQDYKNVEYIIVDGLSNDATMDIVGKYIDKIAITISEKDSGMYDAINKGISFATGDVVGILNSDDVLATPQTISQIVAEFRGNRSAQAVFGDISFVKKNGTCLRYYSAKKWRPSSLAWGFMPPHPTFYCKRELFADYGNYRTDFEIAADFELLIRFLKVNSVTYSYIPQLLVEMRMGGKSTKNFTSTLIINREIKRACDINGVHTNYIKIYLKYFWKIFEFIKVRN